MHIILLFLSFLMFQLRVNLNADNLKKNKPAQGEVDADTGLRLERNALWQVPHFEVGQDTPPDEMHVVINFVYNLHTLCTFCIQN